MQKTRMFGRFFGRLLNPEEKAKYSAPAIKMHDNPVIKLQKNHGSPALEEAKEAVKHLSNRDTVKLLFILGQDYEPDLDPSKVDKMTDDDVKRFLKEAKTIIAKY